jgi:hypothetical protein
MNLSTACSAFIEIVRNAENGKAEDVKAMEYLNPSFCKKNPAFKPIPVTVRVIF